MSFWFNIFPKAGRVYVRDTFLAFGEPSPKAEGLSPFDAEFRDAADKVLYRTNLSVKGLVHGPQDPRESRVVSGEVQLPHVEGATSLLVRDGDRILKRIRRSHPVTVQILYPRANEVLVPDKPWRFKLTDADGLDSVRLRIYASDDGHRYRLLMHGVQCQQSICEFRHVRPDESFQATDSAHLRVCASDGFNLAWSEVGPFQVQAP